MQHHEIIIPGLDRQLCGRCRKWVCRPSELERLKRALATASPKRHQALSMEYHQEVELAKHCINPG